MRINVVVGGLVAVALLLGTAFGVQCVRFTLTTIESALVAGRLVATTAVVTKSSPADFEYEYVVDGETHRSPRIFLQPSLSIVDYVAKYPVGTEVPIQYDPLGPATSTIRVDFSPILPLFGLAFGVLSVLCLCSVAWLRPYFHTSLQPGPVSRRPAVFAALLFSVSGAACIATGIVFVVFQLTTIHDLDGWRFLVAPIAFLHVGAVLAVFALRRAIVVLAVSEVRVSHSVSSAGALEYLVELRTNRDKVGLGGTLACYRPTTSPGGGVGLRTKYRESQNSWDMVGDHEGLALCGVFPAADVRQGGGSDPDRWVLMVRVWIAGGYSKEAISVPAPV